MTAAPKSLTVAHKADRVPGGIRAHMSIRTAALASFASVLALALAGCSGAGDAQTSSDEELSADTATTPIGHYLLDAAGSGDDASWLNEINLHKDGTFDGDFGSGLSNLSGHYFLANGTYTLGSSAQGKSLSFSYSLAGRSATSSFLYAVQAHGLRLKPTDDASEPWFGMDTAAAPVTLTFAADGSAPNVHTLHAGSTALLRYSAARLRCGSGSQLSAFASIDSPQPSLAVTVSPVDGYYDVLVPVDPGKKLSVWFENTAASCTYWDSNDSQNFVFTID
jgi:hypothetical protein